jgi:signal transduction histidine kinase
LDTKLAGTTEAIAPEADPGMARALRSRALAVCEVDPMGRILWASSLFGDIVQRTSTSLVGVDVRTLWPAGERDNFDRVWRKAQERHEFSLDAPALDGSRRTWRLLLPIGQKNGFVWIERDKGAGDALELQRLRELNEMRIQFINTAAHEFATPLTPLRLQTDLLLHERLGPLTDKQRRSLEILDRNMERLGQLVRDVLDVSRIEAGRFHVNLEPVDLAKIARQTVEGFLDTATQHGLALAYEGPGSAMVEGDPDRLTQVFVNLLTNAVKFSKAGGRVRVALATNDNNAHVVVQDSGQGIAPEKIASLFQPFSQVHDTSQETRAGTGLGLSICQGIIAQHGGRIWAESGGLGKGAQFSFLLPLHGAAPAPIATNSSAKSPQPEPGGRWNLFYFKCPQCGSRDIEIRLLKNRYDCNRCKHSWK